MPQTPSALMYAVAAVLFSAAGAVVVVNVGLPRTGTTSFHHAVPLLNFSSTHMIFNTTRLDIRSQLVPLTHDFRTNGSGLFAELCTMYDAFSDTPCYGLIEALRKHRPDVALVATSRSKNSWVNSMQRNPSAGGHYLLHSLLHTQELSSFRAELKQHNKTRSESRLDGLEEVYDNHAALLKKYNVPTIDLTASSAEKFKVLLDSLPETPVTQVARQCLEAGRLEWPNDNKGKAHGRGCVELLKSALTSCALPVCCTTD
eukprot:INCI643.4.p1 GENE.INCI643.4~~INCI643.4.p1  ORF type:complete len:258 (-),score=35.01 INCI643.4:450-1223(-)